MCIYIYIYAFISPIFKLCILLLVLQFVLQGAFADLASFMLISESSLNDLKSKLPAHLQGIPAKQFRPNLVIRGARPYEEDNWNWIKIGENVVMQGFKPCTR